MSDFARYFMGKKIMSQLVENPETLKPSKVVSGEFLRVHLKESSYIEISTTELLNVFTKNVSIKNKATICGYSFYLPACEMSGRKRFSKKDIEKMLNTLLSKAKDKESKRCLFAAKRVLRNNNVIPGQKNYKLSVPL